MESDFVKKLYSQPSFPSDLEYFNKKRKYERDTALKAIEKRLENYALQQEEITLSNDATLNRNIKGQNSHLADKAIKGAKSHALWELEHPNLVLWGYLAGTIPFVVASAPTLAAVGEAGTTQAALGTASRFISPVIKSKTASYLGNALAAGMATHGVLEIKKGNINPQTVLEVSPLAIPVVATTQWSIGVGNNLRPSRLREHVFVSKPPIGYEGIRPALKNITKGILSGKRANIDSPEWFNKGSETILQSYAYIPENVSEAEKSEYLDWFGRHALEARTDAWRMHNLLPLKFGTFTPNPRHSGSWTDIEGIKHLKWIPPQVENISYVDFINSVGGNIGKLKILKLGNGIPDLGVSILRFGVSTTSDWFDLQPFSRPGDLLKDKFIKSMVPPLVKIRNFGERWRGDANKIENFLSSNPEWDSVYGDEELFSMFPNSNKGKRIIGKQIQKLSEKAMDKIHSDRFLNSINKKFANFEVGDITGGKPFLVLYDIPFTTKTRFTQNADLNTEVLPGFLSENIFPQNVFDWRENKLFDNKIYNGSLQ